MKTFVHFRNASTIMFQTKSFYIIILINTLVVNGAQSSLSSIMSSTVKQVVDDNKFTGVRLPSNVKPIHYDLSLKPDLVNFEFIGNIKISYTTSELPSSITLNANELKIVNGFIENDSGQTNPLVKVTYSNSTETATLEFGESISSNGILNLNYSGILNDRLKGFYRTSIKVGNHSITAATTHFEPTGARRCFPCWDEPAIRATFSLKVTFKKYAEVDDRKYQLIALSNMPEIDRSELEGEQSVEVKFEKTPEMSTYLIAIIVGPFEAVEGSDGRRPIRVFTSPGKKEQGRFSLEVACKAMSFYEDYFDVKYPLPKMDLIAIPDFLIGAMENWGLVTYRETALLVDPENTSSESKQFIALVVAHELSHQWFGNLVTIEWWTHLWLKEGFASFMEYLCVDYIFPDYEIWSQFLTDNFAGALRLDALHSSHPIEVPVKNPSEIDEIFDNISYNKGASVIRMLHSYIGDDDFREGMKDYLTKFSYKAAVTEDLWDSLEKASSKPVRRLMSGWTSQMGFPWLKVHNNGSILSLEQAKFDADGEPDGQVANTTWMIPIRVLTESGLARKEVFLMEDKQAKVELDGSKHSWIKLNPGSIDFYRTAYPVEMIQGIKSAIANRTLLTADRLGIQNDYCALAEAGKVSSVQMLELLLAFQNEPEYVVWDSIDICLGRLSSLLAHTSFQSRFHAFGRQLLTKIQARLGWDPKQAKEAHSQALARALIIDRVVSFGDETALREARKRFAENPKAISADLRGACYKAAAIRGDEGDFESLIEVYRSSDLNEEKNRVLRAMGYMRDPARRQKAVEFAFSAEVRNQDRNSFLVPLSVNDPQFGWDLFRKNADKLREMFDGPLLRRLIKPVTENFATQEKADEVAHYFEANKFPGAERTIRQSIETIRSNSKWLQRDADGMKKFLESY